MWRGAYPEAFMSIWTRGDFSKKVMTDNYRSCQQIQNYSNLLCDETRPLYKEVNNLSSVVMLCTTTANWVSAVVPYLDKNKRCALLRYSNANSEIGAKELTEKGVEFTYVLKLQSRILLLKQHGFITLLQSTLFSPHIRPTTLEMKP